MGDVFANVVILFQFPARLRVHSGEGVNGELWLCYMVIVPVKIIDQNFHIRRVFLFLARGGFMSCKVLSHSGQSFEFTFL